MTSVPPLAPLPLAPVGVAATVAVMAVVGDALAARLAVGLAAGLPPVAVVALAVVAVGLPAVLAVVAAGRVAVALSPPPQAARSDPTTGVASPSAIARRKNARRLCVPRTASSQRDSGEVSRSRSCTSSPYS
jgi:hypothetical protein